MTKSKFNRNRRRLIRISEQQNHRCCFCSKVTWIMELDPRGNRELQATIEHIVPQSQGGTLNLKNIAMSCNACNNERGSMDAMEYWQLHQDPEELASWRTTNQTAAYNNRKGRHDAARDRLNLRVLMPMHFPVFTKEALRLATEYQLAA